MRIDPTKNNLFIEGTDELTNWEKDDKAIQKIKVLLKSYLELDNVSFLFGAGSSMNIGSVSIANIPSKIEERIKNTPIDVSATLTPDILHLEFISIIRDLQKENPEKRNAKGEIQYSIERLLNYLVAQEYIFDINPSAVKHKHLIELIRIIKQGLFKLCDLEFPRANISFKRSCFFSGVSVRSFSA